MENLIEMIGKVTYPQTVKNEYVNNTGINVRKHFKEDNSHNDKFEILYDIETIIKNHHLWTLICEASKCLIGVKTRELGTKVLDVSKQLQKAIQLLFNIA
ncbi:hypothetical protein RFI_03022 [Reticulomyxa filosa]|uniref:Uncharacterized protein n=1 Tax=Reticulomyxa filosa TaxID=46433 RepID=X6P8U6_RETFI|nr:hypothetical protein RFI_03022 [Reticulomyxa filosa]|eukprot:ETO34072.1 hypothetical protein RFI_03022 [Reticulomyxa filosa]